MEIPRPGEDRPKLARVGIIAVLGFALGILWPRFFHVHLVPDAPVDDSEAAVPLDSAESAPVPGPSTSAAVPAEKLAPAPGEEPVPAGSQRIEIKESKVTSCRDAEGVKQKSCDDVDYNAVLGPRVQALATCEAADSVQGILSLGFDIDFKAGQVKNITAGKSTTLPDKAAQALVACAAKELGRTTLDGIAHKLGTYTVFYVVELLLPTVAGAAASGAPVDSAAASGHATVGWEVAIIRDKPKDGQIVARILRGTRVVVTGKKDDWYKVKFDAKGTEGWVYRSAIGL